MMTKPSTLLQVGVNSPMRTVRADIGATDFISNYESVGIRLLMLTWANRLSSLYPSFVKLVYPYCFWLVHSLRRFQQDNYKCMSHEIYIQVWKCWNQVFNIHKSKPFCQMTSWTICLHKVLAQVLAWVPCASVDAGTDSVCLSFRHSMVLLALRDYLCSCVPFGCHV